MKVRVTTHSGEDRIIEVEKFNLEDAAEITEQRNDSTVESIQIGIVSFSRIDIKTVAPYEEDEVEEATEEA